MNLHADGLAVCVPMGLEHVMFDGKSLNATC